MTKVNKIDLTLLKKLVSEVEAALASAETIKDAEGSIVEYIVEMAKLSGLTAGVMQEAGMLVADIQAYVMAVQNPAAQQSNMLEKILGPLKPGPGSYGGGGNGSAN
jgi:Na+/alanine symporter